MSPTSRRGLKRRVSLGVLAATIAASLTACSSGGPDSSSRASKAFRVALLTPGPISDAGWNATAYEGLQRIKSELGAQTSHMQTQTPIQFEEGFRDYARQEFDLVIGHGFEFQDAAMKVGSEYPQTTFVTSSGSVSARNVASMTFRLEEATFLAGALAASLSRSGKAGCVGGIELPVIRKTFLGFEAGARAIKSDFVIATTYTGSFEDVAAAKAATDALVAQGADSVIHNANAAGLGVFQSAKQHGIVAFGSNRDQSDVAPETILASAVLSVPTAFVNVAREVKERSFSGRNISYGLKDGVVSFVINPKLSDRIEPSLRGKLDEMAEKIRQGTLPVLPEGKK